MPQAVIALVVMQKDRNSDLIHQLSDIHANVITAASCGEAADQLRRNPRVGVVLTDLSLPDGSWCDVLDRVGDAHTEAAVVVCSRFADETLWTQAIEAGAFDVLVEPYENNEVRRIVDAAATGRAYKHFAAAG